MIQGLLQTHCSEYTNEYPGTVLVSFQDIPLTQVQGKTRLIHRTVGYDKMSRTSLEQLDYTFITKYLVSYFECITVKQYDIDTIPISSSISGIYALFPVDGYTVYTTPFTTVKDLVLNVLIDNPKLNHIDIMRGDIPDDIEPMLNRHFYNTIQPVPFNPQTRNTIHASSWVYVDLYTYLKGLQ